MKYPVLILILIVGSGVCGVAQGQSLTNAPLTNDEITNLVSAIRHKPYTQGEDEVKVAAIKRAAFLRNPDQRIIEVLLDNCSYIPGRGVYTGSMFPPRFSFEPAYDALEIIGEPIVPSLLERLKTNENLELRAGCVRLLRSVIGKERAAQLLKKTISELTEQKARLEKSLELLQKDH